MIKCPNCGGLNPEGVTICGFCAINLEMAMNNPSLQNNNYQNGEPQIIINDFVLTNSYMGRNSFKLSKPGFSLCAFLFGPFYLWYRKMFVLFGIWLFIGFVIWLFYLLTGSYIVVGAMSFIACMYFGLGFKALYISHVNKKVAAIKKQNPGLNQSELEAICKRKGKTTVLPVLIGLVAISIPTYFAGKYAYDTLYTNYHKLRREEFIETAHRAITNVRTDITIKSVHVYDDMIYDRGDITNISDMRINQSPYGEPYKELKVKVRNTSAGLIYSVCMIDMQGNGFAFTDEANLNTSIVQRKTAPSSCE